MVGDAFHGAWVVVAQLVALGWGGLALIVAIVVGLPAAAAFLLKGDEPYETLWQRNWRDGYREFGYLNAPDFD